MPDFTPSEKRVILLISAIIIIAGILQYYRVSYPESTQIDYSLSDSVFSRISHQRYKNKLKDNYSSTKYENEITTDDGKIHSPDVNASVQININTADENELKKLPRIGPAMAKRIIEFRTVNGAFRSIDDLKKIKGIGEKTLAKIKPHLKPIP